MCCTASWAWVESHKAVFSAGGLANNAGIPAVGTIESISPEDILATFKTNAVGPINVIKEFLAHLCAVAAAAASGTVGMSCSKAVMISSISSGLGSLEGDSHTFSESPAFPLPTASARWR
ncbi:unnamed protein product [Arctogadus glacialis]